MEEQLPKKAKKKRSRYRNQPIESKIWHDEKFCRISRFGRELFLYLMTGPQTNMIGLYVSQPGTVAEDLRLAHDPMPKWFADGFVNGYENRLPNLSETVTETVNGVTYPVTSTLWEGYAELIREEMISYDPKAKIVWLRNFLEYNSYANVNVAKAAVAALRDLPATLLIDAFLDFADTVEDGEAGQLRHLYINHFPSSRKPLPKPLLNGTGNQKQEQEQVQEHPRVGPREKSTLDLIQPDPPDWDPSVAYEC